MGRIRTIKPEFFLHDGLATLSAHHRLLFIGLWVIADREGRLLDRPHRIWAAVSPYDHTPDKVDEMLSELANAEDRFIVRYEVDGRKYIQIANFLEHQRPHPKDPDSEIPPPPGQEDRRLHPFTKEKHFQDKLANLASSGGIVLDGEVPESVECSKRIENRYADIVCCFPGGAKLVIEVKKTHVSRSAIKQTLEYCELLGDAVGLVVGTGITANLEPDEGKPVFVGTLNDGGNLELVQSFNVPNRHLTVSGEAFHAPLSNSPIVQESKSPKIPEGGLGETIEPDVCEGCDPPPGLTPSDADPPLAPVARLAFPKATTRSDYDQFYRGYPKNRRGDKNKLKLVWDRHGCDEFADQIVADVGERISSGSWNKNGDFVPGAAKYLEQRQWESEDLVATEPGDAANLSPNELYMRRRRGR